MTDHSSAPRKDITNSKDNPTINAANTIDATKPQTSQPNSVSKDKATNTAAILQSEHIMDADVVLKTLHDSAALRVQWVRDLDELEACLDDLETCEYIALDTEFIKRDTYYPKLALVQINTGTTIYLLDAPRLDLSQFWVVLQEMPLMIWHACGEDLGIFYLLSQCPALTNVFDTQIGLSYLTGQLQIGYQQALANQLDITVDKGESQSDWLARPLTQKQESYAIDDVRYLLSLYEIVRQQLVKKELYDKALEDCQLYAQELYDAANVEDDATYLAMADFRYTGEQLAVLQAVSAWREALARATNQPKTFILKKQAVRDIVVEMPSNIKQLSQNTTMHRSKIRLYGDELLTVINEARALSEAEQPARLFAPFRSKDKTITKAVTNAVKQYEAETGVPANVLMRKKWLSQLYEVIAYDLPLEQLPEGLKGWRRDWVTQTLIPLIESHKAALQVGMGID